MIKDIKQLDSKKKAKIEKLLSYAIENTEKSEDEIIEAVAFATSVSEEIVAEMISEMDF